METSLGSGKQFSTVLLTRSGEAPPTLYCTKDLKAKTNLSRACYSLKLKQYVTKRSVCNEGKILSAYNFYSILSLFFGQRSMALYLKAVF